jgi:hypothetical protein
MRRFKSKIWDHRMSEKKPSQSNQKHKLTSIKATLAGIGVKNSQLPGLLLAEVEKRVAQAKQRADAHIAKAQKKARRIVAKAEESALQQVLKPGHVCRVPARTFTAVPSARPSAENSAQSKEKKAKMVTEEPTS